jgi:hypothetical protein
VVLPYRQSFAVNCCSITVTLVANRGVEELIILLVSISVSTVIIRTEVGKVKYLKIRNLIVYGDN